jgi:hypothetical protein
MVFRPFWKAIAAIATMEVAGDRFPSWTIAKGGTERFKSRHRAHCDEAIARDAQCSSPAIKLDETRPCRSPSRIAPEEVIMANMVVVGPPQRPSRQRNATARKGPENQIGLRPSIQAQSVKSSQWTSMFSAFLRVAHGRPSVAR